MKKLRIMIIVTIIIIIILIISILLLININTHKTLSREEADNQNIENNPGLLLLGLKPEKVTLKNVYFSIEACIDKAKEYADTKDNKALYDLINKEYIEKEKITQNNVIEMTGLNKIEKYKIQEMYEISGMNYSSYYIKTLIQDSKNVYFNINWDLENSAYDIKILTKTEYENYIKKTIEEVKSEEESIKKNDNNSIPYKYLTDEDLIEKYFYDYIETAVDFPEEAYNSIDETYKKAKFGNLEKYKNYIKNNTDIADIYTSYNTDVDDYDNYMEYLTTRKDAGIEKYSVSEKDGHKQYNCIDSYGNNYIFKEKALMEYEIILDTYTIEIPEFTAKYDTSTPQEKVILNINKFMLAINDKDYKYAYNLLADSFKDLNFKTQDEFEQYVKTNFFAKNEVAYEKFGNEAGTYYTYELAIKDKTGTENRQISKTFIILLEEGRNFKLSFNR